MEPCILDVPVKDLQRGSVFVGIDLHKVFLQVAVVDANGILLFNGRVANNRGSIHETFSRFPAGTRCVIESSSVWLGVFRLMQEMGMSVVLSNPYKTRLIAKSRDKTDSNDAHRLAELLRGGYIQACYVADPGIMDARNAVRYRVGLVQNRIRTKNKIHGILLQMSVKIPGTPWCGPHVKSLRALKDWRINEYLNLISYYNERIMVADSRINDIVRGDRGAQLLTTIPGVGAFTAAAVTASIGRIARFRDPDRLISYIGLAPSVRNSADTVRHGAITRFGDKIVRWTLAEAVHSHTRYAPGGSPITRKYARLCRRMHRSKATTAAAAQLLTMMFYMLRDGIDYNEFLRRGNDTMKRRSERHQANIARGRKPAAGSKGRGTRGRRDGAA